MPGTKLTRAQIAAVLVAALGYFVDVYDLLLFSIVRTASLKDLGFEGDALMTQGEWLLSSQMAGMLIGGILWGIWGDKRGRLSVLFGSILMYSLANIANGFVTSVQMYALLRLIAGIGLAGELGAGITLVSEIMPKEKRGVATTIVATVGVCGAIVASLVGEFFVWRTAYFIGGALGLSLLFLRVSVVESGMFSKIQSTENTISKGDIRLLFKSKSRWNRFVHCILIGLPIWAVLGILVTFSPELGRAMNLVDPVIAGRTVLFSYVGLVLGDLASGLLSQYMKSRKLVIRLFLIGTVVSSVAYLWIPHFDAKSLYLWAIPLGFCVGYWAVFVTVAAEQFGINLRATVTTAAPNLVRGAVTLIVPVFAVLKVQVGVLSAATIIVLICSVIALRSLSKLEDTFHRDLDFIED
jgi:MFS family permease